MEARPPMDESMKELVFTLPAMGLWFELGRPGAIPQDDSAQSIALRGLCMMTGLGKSPVDPVASRALLRKAAAMKSLVAIDALGTLVMTEAPFSAEAVDLGKQAAELGWPEKTILILTASSMMGNNPKGAAEALAIAEKYGGNNAYLFWSFYQSLRDQPSARQWLDKALELNSPDAHFDMAEILTAEGRTAEADVMLKTGADLGDSNCAGKILAGYLQQKPHPDTEPLIPRYAEIAASDANPYYSFHYAMTFVDGRGRPADPKAAIPALALLCLTRKDMERTFVELTFSLIDRYYYSPTGEMKLPSSLITDWLFPRLTSNFCKESCMTYMPFLRPYAFIPESEYPKNLIVPA